MQEKKKNIRRHTKEWLLFFMSTSLKDSNHMQENKEELDKGEKPNQQENLLGIGIRFFKMTVRKHNYIHFGQTAYISYSE